MTIARKKLLVAVSMVVLASAAGRAAAVGFTPAGAVYVDEKERALVRPEGVACTDAAVVVADTGNGRLVTYGVKAGQVTGGKEIQLPQLTLPLRVQVDSKGNLLALDGKSRRIVRVDPKGSFKGYLEAKGASGAVVPAAFKLDASDNAYVLEIAARRVLVVDPDGNVVRTVPLPKDVVIADLTVDAAGTLFAVDPVTATVFSADKAATELKPVSKGLKDYMSFPAHITASKGKLYLVDQNGMGVVVLGQDGSFQGRQLSMGATEGLVLYPSQICMNGNAEAFLADRQNNRVQLFKVVQ